MEDVNLEKVPTGIDGLDELLLGGTTPGASIMVEGEPGTGKTTLGMQFIEAGIHLGEPGVYITMEESPARIYRDALSFGWDLKKLEGENKLRVVATSPEALVSQIENRGPLIEAVHEIGARRVVVDSVTLLHTVQPDPAQYRIMLASLVRGLERERLRTMLLRDKEPEGGSITDGFWARHTADVLIDLGTELVHSRLVRRMIQIIKSRGQSHVTGRHAYVIDGSGIQVFPRLVSLPPRRLPCPQERLSIGVSGLDDMLSGGLMCRRSALVSGPTGSGKTLLGLHFLVEGAARGEPGLLVSTEEPPEDTVAHAESVGLDLEAYVSKGLIDIDYLFEPEVPLDEYLYRLRKRLEAKPYRRLVLDSLNSIEIMSPDPSFVSDAIIYLTHLLSTQDVTTLMTYESHTITGTTEVTRIAASATTNTIFLLRFVEIEGDIKKGISVLKHRGSRHATDFRQLIIDEQGMHVLAGFEGYQGVMTGIPVILGSRGAELAAKERGENSAD